MSRGEKPGAAMTAAGARRSPAVIYYCFAHFLDHIPSQVQALSEIASVHVVFEVSPGGWRENLLGLPAGNFPPGVHRADDLVRRALPGRAADYFKNAAGIWYATFPGGRSIGNVTAALEMRRFIRRQAPVVVHIDGDSRRTPLWALGCKAPIVVSVHEPTLPGRRWNLVQRLAKWLTIRSADRLVVFSETARSALVDRKTIASKLCSTSLCTKDVFTQYGDASISEDDTPLVLSVGWLTRRKGLEVLVEAAHRLAASEPEVRFVIAGRPGQDYRSLVSCIAGGPARIEVIERFLTPDELANMLRRAWVVVLPYLGATQSGVVLTAYAFDKPVVASSVGGIREQVVDGETGLLVHSGDPGALETALRGILENGELRQRMASRIAAVRQAELSATTFARCCATLYAELLPSQAADLRGSSAVP
jgi:glycosyltransferase involved in cell wall biosynthesis